MQMGIFDESNRQEKITKLGDCLEQIGKVVDFNQFIPILNKVFRHIDNGKGGRPPYSSLLMFKILLLKRLYNLSYDQTEYQINDRISFMRFLGLTISDRVPDAKTIWLYEDIMSKHELGKELFTLFFRELAAKGYIAEEGRIVDATFIEAPKRKNTAEQREKAKKGEVPEEWKDKPQKLLQRDLDATWTKKAEQSYFGYKNNVKADLKSKLIVDYTVTTASACDAEGAEELVDKDDKVLYADAAYAHMEIPEEVENMTSEKAERGHPLSEEQRANNHVKAQKRCRIEHIFGNMVKALGGTSIRCKGMLRAAFEIALLNLLYNIRRVVTLNRLAEEAAHKAGRQQTAMA